MQNQDNKTTALFALILAIMIGIAVVAFAEEKNFFIVSREHSARGNRVLRPMHNLGLGVSVKYGAPLKPGSSLNCKPVAVSSKTVPPSYHTELVCNNKETILIVHEIIWERRR